MIDTKLQERFTRSCTDAAFGYTAATTAACAAWADQVFDFWAQMLQPPAPPKPEPQTFFGWPIPLAAPAPKPAPPAPNPMAAFGWPIPQWPATPPATTQFPFQAPANPYMSNPYMSNPFMANPYMAMFNMFPFAAATPAGPAWPMAFMMIAAGMPQSVAWPTAKANAAVMDAADVAAVSVHKAFSSYRSEGGHASVPASNGWPVANLMMLAVLIPLAVNPVLSAMRVA